MAIDHAGIGEKVVLTLVNSFLRFCSLRIKNKIRNDQNLETLHDQPEQMQFARTQL